MTERFTMDNPNDWGFPITDNDTGKVYSCASNQLMKDLCDVINKIVKENEQLKSDNFNLNKTVECLNETVKEQCNKIDWADECGVRWNEEYNEWIGDVE